MKIEMTTAPYSEMRYETAGDWYYRGDALNIVAVALGSWKMEACLQVHELTEALICKYLGVSQEAVDEFDMTFKGEGEPGDAPDCPYRIPHKVASAVEYILALALDLDWQEYEDRLRSL